MLFRSGAIAWYVSTRSKDKAVNDARKEKGTLIASGFIAGGALMGVVSVMLRFFEINLLNHTWQESNAAGYVAIVAYVAIIAYLIWDSLRAKPEKIK